MFANVTVAPQPPERQCISTAEALSFAVAKLPMERMWGITHHLDDCAECAERVRVAVASRAS